MTLIPRGVIGKYLNGTTIGLKTSLPGINALTADDTDGTKFSFNSEWNDFVKVHQIGISTLGTVQTNCYFPTLAYKPFVEVRRVVGNVVYDDYAQGFNVSGLVNTVVTGDYIRFDGWNVPVLYVVYKIPVAVP